jgi:hypothetical protein
MSDEHSAFLSVPRTGVIYVTAEAQLSMGSTCKLPFHGGECRPLVFGDKFALSVARRK